MRLKNCVRHMFRKLLIDAFVRKANPVAFDSAHYQFSSKTPQRHAYVLSLLPSLIVKLKSTDTLHFDGMTKCIFMIRSAEAFAILFTLPRQYIVSRVLSTGVYKALVNWMSQQPIRRCLTI